MARYPSSTSSFSFGPGAITPAIKALIGVNVAMFVLNLIVRRAMTLRLGLVPAAVLGDLALWQPVTYMFLHDTGGLGHILINMLSLWMFGTELERTWGTRFFVKYYFVCGVGAAAMTILLSILPLSFAGRLFHSVTVGASGAIYGLLLGYGLYFPNRPIFLYFVFPIPAKYFVMIIGAIAFFSSLGGPGGTAHAAHLGGLVVGYLYLKGLRARPLDELKYRWLRWRMSRARGRFDVISGGRSNDDDWKQDWKKHVH